MLGCLNHALLTYYYNILQMKAPLLGWIANCLEENFLLCEQNIHTLKGWINAPCLGVVPFGLDKIRNHSIDINRLWQSL